MDESNALAQENNNPAALEEKPEKKKRIDPVGLSMYGAEFETRLGRFNRMGEVRDLVPLWKDYFYKIKCVDYDRAVTSMLREFNEVICYPDNRTFYVQSSQIASWRKRWERDIMLKSRGFRGDPDTDPALISLIETSVREGILTAPEDESLEKGVRTLAGELMNDAATMLKDDQEMADIFTNDELIKRRGYILNVFSHVTKMVQGKALIMLKKSQDTRENAGFLMTLLAKASAGELNDEQMAMLDGANATVTIEQNAPST